MHGDTGTVEQRCVPPKWRPDGHLAGGRADAAGGPSRLARQCGHLLERPGYGACVALLVGGGTTAATPSTPAPRSPGAALRVEAMLLPPERAHAAGVGRARGTPAGDSRRGGRGTTLAGADLVVDGIVGIGGKGELRGAAATVARAARDVLTVAVDVPSGVDADTGGVGEDAIRADITVTFGALKPGLVDRRGRATAPARCGSSTSAWPPTLPDARPTCSRRATSLSDFRNRRRPTTSTRAASSAWSPARRSTPAPACCRTGAALYGGAGMVRYLGPAPGRDPRSLPGGRRPPSACAARGPGAGLGRRPRPGYRRRRARSAVRRAAHRRSRRCRRRRDHAARAVARVAARPDGPDRAHPARPGVRPASPERSTADRIGSAPAGGRRPRRHRAAQGQRDGRRRPRTAGSSSTRPGRRGSAPPAAVTCSAGSSASLLAAGLEPGRGRCGRRVRPRRGRAAGRGERATDRRRRPARSAAGAAPDRATFRRLNADSVAPSARLDGVSRSEAVIDLDAVRGNVATLKRATPAEVMAVVKADGYGHGLLASRPARRSPAVRPGSVPRSIDEALALRAAGHRGAGCWPGCGARARPRLSPRRSAPISTSA